ncbi:MAG: bifunctional phosphoribosyl-AMP cyclohydrolase/phosphoribosyl-ATP diphosphatase HisIE [Saprospiraceae bacterium]
MIPDFNKANGLIPVVVQDVISLQVLMLGYMNEEAYYKTLSDKKITFFSRSKNRLWTKGETSGHFLYVDAIHLDCDHDTLLILARADGPTCHTGAVSCFNTQTSKGFLYRLEQTIHQRIENNDANSYTNKLYKRGINKVAQKLGEEAVELIIEAKDNNADLFKNEAADLLYHFLILLKAKGSSLEEIEQVLLDRGK